MSNFMVHIHRDTETLRLFDETALRRPTDYDLSPSDDREPVMAADPTPAASPRLNSRYASHSSDSTQRH
jgi:hypothetical protein